ncbi:hypothetical protein HanRHA438_Chr05g0228821 [Helianthus annuus]|nr:hypothetical protein HanRHA438_Chr05g0228821 [Helianthus annuus]
MFKFRVVKWIVNRFCYRNGYPYYKRVMPKFYKNWHEICKCLNDGNYQMKVKTL